MRHLDELTCREVVELVTDYLEGTLSPGEARRVELHLVTCPPCTSYLAQMRETIRLVGRIEQEDLTPEARDDLVRAFQGWRSAA